MLYREIILVKTKRYLLYISNQSVPRCTHLSTTVIKTNHLMLYRKINLLNTERNLVYISNQFVPRCKHFPVRL
jgi:hypothetical protein